MTHKIESDFYAICTQIISEGKTADEWAELESDDLFSEGNYEGGFDATEMEFCFRVYVDEQEYWFQLPLNEVEQVCLNQKTEIDLRPAES